MKGKAWAICLFVAFVYSFSLLLCCVRRWMGSCCVGCVLCRTAACSRRPRSSGKAWARPIPTPRHSAKRSTRDRTITTTTNIVTAAHTTSKSWWPLIGHLPTLQQSTFVTGHAGVVHPPIILWLMWDRCQCLIVAVWFPAGVISCFYSFQYWCISLLHSPCLGHEV